MIKILTFLIIILSTTAASAYDPPIGIPDPSMFGGFHPIDTVSPDETTKCPSWPTASTAHCYYIDNSHQDSTDVDNTYGYPDKPRATIPNNKTLLAGTYMLIAGGPYVVDLITVYPQGTELNPVWIRGTTELKPDIQAPLRITNAKYTIVENLKFSTGMNSPGVKLSGSVDAHHVSIRNNIFRDIPIQGTGAAIGATPAEGGNINNIVVYGNIFSDIGDYLATEDTNNDHHAMLFALYGRNPPTTVYNIWVLNNTGYHIGGSFVQFNGDERSEGKAENAGDYSLSNMGNLHHVYVGHNYSSHSRQDLSVTKMTRDAVISQNKVHNAFNGASGHGAGVVFQEGPDYVWTIFNEFYDTNYGVKEGNMYYPRFKGFKHFVVGNVIYNMTPQVSIANPYNDTSRWKGGQGYGTEKANIIRYVVDNTIYNCAGGISMTTSTGDEAWILGNAITGINGVDGAGDADYHISKLEANGAVYVDHNYTQYRQDTGTSRFVWSGGVTVKSTSVPAFQISTGGQCMNCLEGADPLFVDTETNNFRPQAGSPLIGANARHEVYDIFEARYGLSIDVDFDGNPRPPTAAEGRTIGAFEYNSSYVPECDQYHPSLCPDPTSCTGAGLNWCGDELTGNCQIAECGVTPTCSDLIQNGDETGIDCGGSSCPPCETPTPQAHRFRMAGPVKIVNQQE
jgi:hypothetical protein